MLLNQTPPQRLVDPKGRPYFLWDADLTLVSFQQRLRDEDPEVRAYVVGKLLRQAKPDDVFLFVTMDDIDSLWPQLERYLGHSRPFWSWLLDWWRGRRGDCR
ncbi:MAG: hypothetical protein IT379_05095 [Deltaproteobacteria bacterium]|nr:hypothetical protein [Deltaproteobacteria bacterium]